MRISELSRQSGVPVATIKFYLREGLLPAGELTSATQARYGADHLARVRLIRALTVSAGLSVAVTRGVLQEMDDPTSDPLEVLGRTHALIDGPVPEVDTTAADALLAELGWTCQLDQPGSTAALAQALATVADAGFEIPDGMLHLHGELMARLAEAEIAHLPQESVSAAIRYVVLGTIVMEPVLLALRRLAENEAAIRRFAPGPGAAERPGAG